MGLQWLEKHSRSRSRGIRTREVFWRLDTDALLSEQAFDSIEVLGERAGVVTHAHELRAYKSNESIQLFTFNNLQRPLKHIIYRHGPTSAPTDPSFKHSYRTY